MTFTKAVKMLHDKEVDMIKGRIYSKHSDYIGIYYTELYEFHRGIRSFNNGPWVPNVEDILADDWEVVE